MRQRWKRLQAFEMGAFLDGSIAMRFAVSILAFGVICDGFDYHSSRCRRG